MNDAITITIDRAGRLVIPKEIREAAGIEPGMPLVVTCRDGRIEIEPRRRPVRIVQKGRLQVAISADTDDPLTREVVSATQQKVRR
jgi:AbrB family looped-hinge helix DNA binding protein